MSCTCIYLYIPVSLLQVKKRIVKSNNNCNINVKVKASDSPGTPVSSTNKTRYSWNNVESGVKHHNPKPKLQVQEVHPAFIWNKEICSISFSSCYIYSVQDTCNL